MVPFVGSARLTLWGAAQFVASIAPIVRDADAARLFYQDALDPSLEGEDGGYKFTHKLEGTHGS
jgi:hypothetical protein